MYDFTPVGSVLQALPCRVGSGERGSLRGAKCPNVRVLGNLLGPAAVGSSPGSPRTPRLLLRVLLQR